MVIICDRDRLISEIVGVMVRGFMNLRMVFIRLSDFMIIWVREVRIRFFWICMNCLYLKKKIGYRYEMFGIILVRKILLVLNFVLR